MRVKTGNAVVSWRKRRRERGDLDRILAILLMQLIQTTL